MRYWVCPTADHSLTCPGTWWQTAHLHCTPEREEGGERMGGEEGSEKLREGGRGGTRIKRDREREGEGETSNASCIL